MKPRSERGALHPDLRGLTRQLTRKRFSPASPRSPSLLCRRASVCASPTPLISVQADDARILDTGRRWRNWPE